MIFSKRVNITENGTRYKREQNKAKSTDSFASIFGNPDIDLKDTSIVNIVGVGQKYSRYTPDTNTKVNGVRVNEGIVNSLISNLNFFNPMQSKVLSNSQDINLTFSQQIGKTSTVNSTVAAWKNLKQLESNKVGSLFTFDTETFGATSRDKRWNPAGITEFAMYEHNFATGQKEKTNIVFANKENIEALDALMVRYEKAYEKGGYKEIQKDNELYVTAMRLSLYDKERGADIVKNDKGYFEAKNILASEDHMAGNIDSVRRGYENLKRVASETKIDNETGLGHDVLAFIDSVGKMQTSVANKTGIISGHNITNFDRPIVDIGVNKIYSTQLGIINSNNASPVEKAKAQNAINYIHQKFNISQNNQGYVGLTFENGYTLDTLAVVRQAREHFGLTSIFGKNKTPMFREGLDEAGNQIMGLDVLANVFLPDDVKTGVAHLGIHDALMNQLLILKGIGDFNGSSLIGHLIENTNNGGLSGLVSNNKIPTSTLNTNQVFKAVGNYASSGYSNRGFLNYVRYNNGEIYTNSNYHVGVDGVAEHSKFAGNTGFSKGSFYKLNSSNKVKLSSLNDEVTSQLREVYPEFNSEYIYMASFDSVQTNGKKIGHSVNMFATTEEELEGIIGSSLAHVATWNEKKNDFDIVTQNSSHLKTAVHKHKTGKVHVNKPKNMTGKELLSNAIDMAERQKSNDSATRAIFNSDKYIKRVSGMLDFHNTLMSSDVGGHVQHALENGLTMSDIIVGREGNFTSEQMEFIQNAFINSLGHEYNKQMKIDFRTKQNLAYGYENIILRKDYYSNLLEASKKHYGIEDLNEFWKEKGAYDKGLLNDFFANLDDKMRVEAAIKAGATGDKVVDMARELKPVSVETAAQFKNRYEFKLGKRFNSDNKVVKIVNPLKGNNNEDIVTFNMGKNNASVIFMNDLFKAKMDGKDTSRMSAKEKEKHTRQAVYDFFIDLEDNRSEHKELFKYNELGELIKNMRKNAMSITEGEDLLVGFDVGQSVDVLHSAIKFANGINPGAGIIKTSNRRDINYHNSNFIDSLNNLTLDEIKESIKTGTTIKFNHNDKGSLEQTAAMIKRNYTMNDSHFEEKIAHLNEVHQATLKLIKQDIDEKLTTRIEDILKASDMFGISLHQTEMGLVASKNGEATILDTIPIFRFEDGVATVQSGNSKLGVNLRLATKGKGKNVRSYLTTNLDEAFGKEDVITKAITNSMEQGGKVDLGRMNQIIGLHKRELRESTLYTGSKNDKLVLNNKFDVSEMMENMFYEMFREGGELNYLLDDYQATNPNLVNKFRQQAKSMKDGNIAPDLFMYAINDIIDIAKATLHEDVAGNELVNKIINHIGASNKDTQVSKGIFHIGQRVLGNWMNVFDNTQRPPMTGAGNVNYIDVERVKEAGKKRFVLSNSIIESQSTLDLIQQNGRTSDISYRQAYVAAPVINSKMKSQREIILNADIDNRTISKLVKDKKARVYDKVAETVSSGTFEQARLLDARMFRDIMDMPVDVQYLSPFKDIEGAFNDSTNQESVQRLVDLIGSISRDEKGNLSYERRAGTLVKKGEAIAEYVGYGGINGAFGTKMPKGVLSFSIRDNDNVELSTEKINALLNKHSGLFDNNYSDEDNLRTLVRIMQAENYKTTYKVENVNNASLPKILTSGGEKGMGRILQSTVGELNDDNKVFFTNLTSMAKELGLDYEKYDFVEKNIPTKNAIDAAINDISIAMRKRDGNIATSDIISRLGIGTGINTSKKLYENVLDEQLAISEMVFGKHGAFHGVSSLANDNVPGHGNFGVSTTGKFADIVAMYGKALDPNKEMTSESYYKALEIIKDEMNNNSAINFFGETVGGSTKNAAVKELSIKNGTIIVSDNKKGESSFLDSNKLVALTEFVDNKINELHGGNAPMEDRLVHKNILIYQGEGKYERGDYYGSAFIGEHNNEAAVLGSYHTVNTAVVRDGETVSGVSQEYIDLVRKINVLRSKSNLEHEEVEALAELTRQKKSIDYSVKFMRIDDQALAILEQNSFSSAMAEEMEASLKAKDKSSFFTTDKLLHLEEATGGLISRTGDNSVAFSSELDTGKSSNHVWLKKLRDSRYYNNLSGEVLTEELMEKVEEGKPDLRHLKEIYDDIVVGGIAPKIGVQEAQDLYDLRRVHAAAIYNNTHDMSLERLQNEYGFKMKSIKDFVGTGGSTHNEAIGSILKEHTIIDLGEEFEKENRYLAIPGLGKEVGDEEVRKAWQKNVEYLKRDYDKLEAMHGDGIMFGVSDLDWSKKSELERSELLEKNKVSENSINERHAILASIRETAQSTRELTNFYNRKDTLFSKYSQIEVQEAQQRLKITSITGDLVKNSFFEGTDFEGMKIDSSTNSDFMNTAKILLANGKKESLADLEKRGIFYDYERVGLDYFENAGYFNDESYKKFGVSGKEEMINYLQEHGTMRTVTRYPQINNNSIYNSRVYLDRTLDGTNTVNVAAHSMLKYIGDSDGDSESGFNTTIDGINYALYEKKKMDAIESVRADNEGKVLSKLEFSRQVEERVKNDGAITEDAYKGFTAMSAEMSRVAAMDNAQFIQAIKATNEKDVKNNIFTGASLIRFDEKENRGMFQIKDAVSDTFANKRIEALTSHLDADVARENISNVDKYIKLAFEQNEKGFLKANEVAGKIAGGEMSIEGIVGADKYRVMDEALSILEKDKNIGKEVKDHADAAFTLRVRANQLYEEESAKATKGAIGSVNTSLNSLKVASKKIFEDQSNEKYNPSKANLFSSITYQIEQDVISGKKVAYEVGDTRLLEIEGILNSVRKNEQPNSTSLKNNLGEWLNTYSAGETTEKMWNSLGNAEKLKLQNTKVVENKIKYLQENFTGAIEDVSQQEWETRAKNHIIAEKFLDSASEIVNSPGGKAIVDNISAINKRGSTATRMVQGGVTDGRTMGGELTNIIKGTPRSDIESVSYASTIRDSMEESQQKVAEEINIVRSKAMAAMGDITPPKIGGSLGLAALGVAAGVLLAGYAGGGNSSRPTRPVDDTQPAPQSVPEFFDQEPSQVQTTNQRGYVINVKANTKKGEEHMKKAMREAVKATATSGSVNVNMNYRTTRSGGYSNKDIENIINNYI